ncbi:MAG: anhydro-N-acetylmuramic acid kinase, partial [Ferruginibacter sp.]
MNANIDRLYKIGLSPSRLIIGLMSGTSVDGLDVALCNCKGSGSSTEVDIIRFETVGYNDDYRQEIKSVFSKHQVSLEKVCMLNGWIAAQHAAIINDCLKKWQVDPETVDLLASHGQTIYHAPKFMHEQDKFSNATLQIGDGDHLAVKTGITTISDFRQKHIAAGGEGAPLAVYGDYLVFSKKGENRILLNIGGIANFTYLPGNLDGSRVFSTDTGPGNTLMDAYVQQNFHGLYFDQQSAIAGEGTVNKPLLDELKKNEFFLRGFPKTTGPELFNLSYAERAKAAAGINSISHKDMMATLNRFSADTIVDALQKGSSDLTGIVIYTSGGGMHNPLLMQNIGEQLPGYTFKTTDHLGINPDAKEA